MDDLINIDVEFQELCKQIMSNVPDCVRNPELKNFELWWKLMSTIKENNFIDCSDIGTQQATCHMLENYNGPTDNDTDHVVASKVDLICDNLLLSESHRRSTSYQSFSYDDNEAQSSTTPPIMKIEIDQDSLLLRQILSQGLDGSLLRHLEGMEATMLGDDSSGELELEEDSAMLKSYEFSENEMSESYLPENELQIQDKFIRSAHDMTLESLIKLEIKQNNKNLVREKKELKEDIAQKRSEYMDNLVKLELDNIKINEAHGLIESLANKETCTVDEIKIKRTESLEKRARKLQKLTQTLQEEKSEKNEFKKEYKHLKTILIQTKEKYKTMYDSLERERSKIPLLVQHHRIRVQMLKGYRDRIKTLKKEVRTVKKIAINTKKKYRKMANELKKPEEEILRFENEKKKLYEAERRRAEAACKLSVFYEDEQTNYCECNSSENDTESSENETDSSEYEMDFQRAIEQFRVVEYEKNNVDDEINLTEGENEFSKCQARSIKCETELRQSEMALRQFEIEFNCHDFVENESSDMCVITRKHTDDTLAFYTTNIKPKSPFTVKGNKMLIEEQRHVLTKNKPTGNSLSTIKQSKNSENTITNKQFKHGEYESDEYDEIVTEDLTEEYNEDEENGSDVSYTLRYQLCLEFELQKEKLDHLDEEENFNYQIAERKTQISRIKREMRRLKNNLIRFKREHTELSKYIKSYTQRIAAIKRKRIHPLARRICRAEKLKERQELLNEKKKNLEQLQNEKNALLQKIDLEMETSNVMKQEIKVLKFQRELLKEATEKDEEEIENEKEKFDTMRQEYQQEMGTLEEILAKYRAELSMLSDC